MSALYLLIWLFFCSFSFVSAEPTEACLAAPTGGPKKLFKFDSKSELEKKFHQQLYAVPSSEKSKCIKKFLADHPDYYKGVTLQVTPAAYEQINGRKYSVK